jgi:integrase
MVKSKFTFTRAALRDLRLPLPGQRWKFFHDETTRGLSLGVSSTGAKSFCVYRKFKRRPLMITLGLFDPEMPDARDVLGAQPLDYLGNRPALNVPMARKLATAVMAQLDMGIDPRHASPREGMTLGELFARYAAHRRAEGKKTVHSLVWMWERYLGHLPDLPKKTHGAKRSKAPGAVDWERRLLSEVSYEQVSRLRLDLGEKVGRTTANRVLELLRAMYNFARKQRLYREENPAENNGKFQLASRERFLQDDEVQGFFNALDADGDKDFADYVLLSLYVGARRSNVLGMRWSDLSLDGARWAVAGEVTKNGDPLSVPLVEEAVEILRRRSSEASTTENANSQWVFPGGSEAGHMGPPRRQWKRLIKAAGLPDLRLHDLRRSLGSWMSRTGANTVMTMLALGHKTIDAALVYQRLDISPVRDAMQRAVSAISQARKGPKAAVIEMPRRKVSKKAGQAGQRE